MLRLDRIPDRTPRKLTVAIEPDLHDSLSIYARLYAEAYGDEATIETLIPHMLEKFIASDTGFKRARKALNARKET